MREVDRKYSLKKTKLLKTTIFPLLVAVIMIGSAVTGLSMNLNEKTTMIADENTAIIALGDDLEAISANEDFDEVMNIVDTGESSEYKTRTRATIVWDNGMDYIGLYRGEVGSGVTSIIADDFFFAHETEVMDVHWIGGYWGGSAETPWCIEIYEDNGGEPGDTYAGPFCFDWADIDKVPESSYWLMNVDIPAVTCAPYTTYWIAIYAEGTSSAPYAGPAMHWSVKPGTSEALWYWPENGFDGWFPTGAITGYPPADMAFQLTTKPAHDVGVSEIKHPTHEDSPGCPCIPVEVEVRNYGASDEVDVPVTVEIHQNMWTQTFGGDYPDEMPFYIVGQACTWQTVMQETCYPYAITPFHGNYFMELNQCGCLGYSELITEEPTSLTGDCIDPVLKFYFWHDTYSSDDYMDVWISNGPAGPWSKIGGPYERLCCPECPVGWKEYRIDLAAYVGQTVYFNFVGHCEMPEQCYNLGLDYVCVFDMQYQETQLVDIDSGETKQVEFPCWPGECWWCQYENEYVLFWVGAWTDMEGDQNPANDGFGPFQDAFIPVWIYIPWTHDVGDKEILEPSAPYYMAQPLPMKQLIKNYGKEPEGCFNVYMAVKELSKVTKLFETFDNWELDPDRYPTYYYMYRPVGWTEVSCTYEYGWEKSYTSNAGGTSPEAYLSWTRACYYQDNSLISPSINTLGEDKLELEFKSFIDDYNGGYYATIEARADPGDVWTDYTPWANPIQGNEGPDTYLVDITPEIGYDTQIKINFYGYYYYLDYWYLDDVKLISYTCGETLWQDKVCVDDIQVCEEQEVVFDDFIPEPPEECYCGTVDYCIDSWTKMLDPPDQNSANDLKRKFITVEFLHDVAIKEFTSPAYDLGKAILWDNGPDNGANGLSDMYWPSYPLDREVVDDFFNTETWTVTDGHFSGTTYYCSGPGDIIDVNIFFYEDEGGTPSMTRYAEEQATSITASASGCELTIDVEFDPVVLPAGDWWVCFQPVIEDNFFWNTADGQGNAVYVSYPDAGFPKWTPGSNVFGVDYDVSFQLTGTIGGGGSPGYPEPDVYIPCGEQEFCVMIENLGTYDEDVDVVWNFYEYTPTKELVDGGSIAKFIASLTEEEVCLFTYEFEEEGIYGVEVEVISPPDCNLDNNGPIELIVGVDCCGPESCFTLDPEEPNGENNWFTTKVTVTAYAWEGGDCLVHSGIAKIVYIIDGVEDFITGDHGTFTISGDGVHFGEIYAVDNVGNEEEEHHTFEVAIDKTAPSVDLQHDEYKDEAGTWFVHFTAIASDATSGMNRVEFFIDGNLQETDTTGPFEWTIEWDPDYKTKTFYAYAYDNAGNSGDDNVAGSDIPIGGSKPKDHSQQQSKTLSRTIVNQTPKGIF
jgi:hypothetical protein